MSTSNDELKVRVTADISGLSKGMDEAGKAVEGLGKKTDEAGRSAQGAGKAVETVRDALGSMASDAAQAAGATGSVAESVGSLAVRCATGAAGAAGLALAVGGALVVAFEKGRSEAEAYEKALILTGNAAGTTAERLGEIAARVADATGATVQASATVVAGMAGTGQVAEENIQRVAQAAAALERAGVQSAEKTVAAMAEIGRDPVKAAEKLNETVQFLTGSLYEQINALQETGRVSEAAALAQLSFADASESAAKRIEQNFGYLEQVARGVADAAKGMWDAVLGVGRKTSDVERIAELQQKMAPGRGIFAGISDDEKAELAMLLKRREENERNAKAQEDATRQEKAKVEWIKLGDQYQSKAERREAEIAKARQMGLAAGAAEVEIEKTVAAIREKYADKEKKPKKETFDYQAYAEELNQVNAVRKNEAIFLRGHLAEMQDLYRMGLVTEEDYVRARSQTAMKDLEAEERRYQRLGDVARKYGRKGDAARADGELEAVRAQRNITEAAAERDLLVLTTQRQRALDGWMLSERDALDAIELERSLIGATTQDVERLTYARRIDLQVRNATRFADGTLRVPQNVADAYESAGEALKRARETQTVRDAADRGDWLVGARKGLAEYQRTAENVAGSVERSFQNAAQGMEDAWVSMVQTGKLNFSSLANSVVADIARMQFKAWASPIMNALGSAISNYFSGGSSASTSAQYSLSGSGGNLDMMGGGQGISFGGGRAGGGPVSGGMLYEVNEKGPELLTSGGRTFLMMGSTGGTVTPASSGSGSSPGPQTIRVEIHNDGTPQEATGAVPTFDATGTVVHIFTRDLQRNGPMAQALTAFKGRR